MNCNAVETVNWYPEYLIDVGKPLRENYAVVILNRKILLPSTIITNLWEKANLRVTVDGGTNRWLQFIQENISKSESLKPPDLITGDFDSVTEETFSYFDKHNCKRVHTPDQNETDFTKTLRVMKPIISKENIKTIVVIHETSGRLDQIMANINTLFKVDKILNNISVHLLSSNSLTWLLHPNKKHSISIPSSLVNSQRWCAIIPIGDKCNTVSTTGLRWNLDNHKLQFGGIVSTSNTYSTEKVTITASEYLLWSMGVFNFDDD